jgi:thiol-disulfide isomerase/thioredoxin
MKRGGAIAFFSRNMNQWMVLGLVFVFIVLAVMIVQYYSAARNNKVIKNVANMTGKKDIPIGNGSMAMNIEPSREGFGSGTGDIQAMFFNVDWCPHCVKAKPEWAEFVNKHSGDSNITFVGGADGTNCTDDSKSEIRSLIQKYNIQHFPTVIFVKNGTPTEYQGRVSADSLDDFLNTL